MASHAAFHASDGPAAVALRQLEVSPLAASLGEAARWHSPSTQGMSDVLAPMLAAAAMTDSDADLVQPGIPASAGPVRLTVTPTTSTRSIRTAPWSRWSVRTGCADVRAAFCCHVAFFACEQTAPLGRPHPNGRASWVTDAHRLAKMTNQRCLTQTRS